MSRLLNAKPKVTYLNSEPYSPEEIDALENSGRTWATLVELRREAQEEFRRSYDNGYRDGRFDAGDHGDKG